MNPRIRPTPYLYPIGLLAFTLYQSVNSGYFTRVLSGAELEALYGVSNLVTGDYFLKGESLHPPLTYAVLALWSLLSDSESWMRTILFLCYAATALLLYRLLLKASGQVAAAIAVTLLGLAQHKLFLYVTFLNYALPFLVCCLLLSLYQRYRELPSTGAIWQLSAFTGIAILFHYSIFFIALAIWISVLLDRGAPNKISRSERMAFGGWFVPLFLITLAHHLWSGSARGYLEVNSLRATMTMSHFLKGLYAPTIGLFPESIAGTLPPNLVLGSLIFYNQSRTANRFPFLRLLGVSWLLIAIASLTIKFPWSSPRHLFVLILPLFAIVAIGAQNLLEITLLRWTKKIAPATITIALLIGLTMFCVTKGTSPLWYRGSESPAKSLPQFFAIWERICPRPVKNLGLAGSYFISWYVHRQPFGRGSRLALIPLRGDRTFDVTCPLSPETASTTPLTILSPKDPIKPPYPLGRLAYRYDAIYFY